MKGDITTHTYTAQGRKNHDKIKWGVKVECDHAREDCEGCRHHGPHLPVLEDEGECNKVAQECAFHGLPEVKCVPVL